MRNLNIYSNGYLQYNPILKNILRKKYSKLNYLIIIE